MLYVYVLQIIRVYVWWEWYGDDNSDEWNDEYFDDNDNNVIIVTMKDINGVHTYDINDNDNNISDNSCDNQ